MFPAAPMKARTARSSKRSEEHRQKYQLAFVYAQVDHGTIMRSIKIVSSPANVKRAEQLPGSLDIIVLIIRSARQLNTSTRQRRCST